MLPYVAVDGLATVITDDLVVRSLPEISDASVIDPVLLQEGRDLFVLGGPRTADGHHWYYVAPLWDPEADIADAPVPRIGWVAAGQPADPWIGTWTGQCPKAELAAIWRERPLERLACFGDEELILEGVRGHCSYSVPGYIEPLWLNHAACELLPLGSDASDFGRMTFTFHQDTVTPPVGAGDGVVLRIIGHFDDPAAQACTAGELPGSVPPPPELIVLDCRSRFVATEVTEVAGP